MNLEMRFEEEMTAMLQGRGLPATRSWGLAGVWSQPIIDTRWEWSVELFLMITHFCIVVEYQQQGDVERTSRTSFSAPPTSTSSLPLP